MFKFDFDPSKLKKAIGEAVSTSDVEISCPQCSSKNKVKGSDIAARRTITCAGCRIAIELRDSEGSFGRMIRGQ